MPGHDLQTSTVKHGTEINREMVVGHGYEGTIEATFYLDQELDLKSYLDSIGKKQQFLLQEIL